MAIVLEYTIEKQHSVVRLLWEKGHKAKDIHKKNALVKRWDMCIKAGGGYVKK
jgi:hypothetical protein